MDFRFKRKESVAKGVRRLGRQRIENALECLKDCRQAEAIHCARKDIKKARAVLRMVRPNIVRKEFRQFTKLLREAASHLAATRDAYVKAKALANLARHFKGQLAPGALRHIRSHVRRASDDEMKRFIKEKGAKSVERLLRSVAKEFEGLEISGKGWKAIGSGVKSAYGEGLRAYQTVLKDPAPENFHEWRKRVKDLWYQISLLRPVWPEQMDAIARELETLGEYLGDDHDLFILQQSVREQCAGDGDQRELEVLHGLIEERQRELRAAAVALGTRFYAEKSSTFCERLGGYWNTWRREKNPCAQSAEATP